ncbi:hypothetical protein GCM10027578_16930 [Spirosoma luteolum]
MFPRRNRGEKQGAEQRETALAGWPDTTSPAFGAQFQALFDPLIRERLTQAEQADAWLVGMVRVELFSLLTGLPDPGMFAADQHRLVVAQLVDACRWRGLIRRQDPKAARFSIDALVQQSRHWQVAIEQVLTQLRQGPPANQLKRLASLLTDSDVDAVVYRTMRALLTGWCKESSTLETAPVFWLRNNGIELRPQLFKEYLTDQIALRVYLFHSREEAYFIETATLIVSGWVRQKIRRQVGALTDRLSAGIEDMISKVKFDFIRKCDRYASQPEEFMLDARLTTFLYAFVKVSHAIDKLLESVSSSSPQTAAEFDEWMVQTDPVTGLPETADDAGDDYLDEQKRWLDRLLARLPGDCEKLIRSRYNNEYSDLVPFFTLSIAYKQNQKTLEGKVNACLEELKEMASKLA